MRPLVAAMILAGVGSVAAATTVAVRSTAPELAAQERVRHGPDSSRVAGFLAALERLDPAVCEMLSDQVGNFWWSDGGAGIGRLDDTRPGARAAKDSLAAPVRDAKAIALLAATLDHADPCVRFVAAKMLGNGEGTDAVIERALGAGSARVREAALRAAGERDRLALRGRVERMLEAEPAVAAMAAWALGEWEQRASVAPLRRSLSHAAPRVRAAAAWALGAIEDASVAPELERLLAGDPDRRVRLAAVHALSSFDLEAPVSDALLAATESADAELREAALEAVFDIEDPRLVPLFLRVIRDPDPELRARAIHALGELKAREAIAAITRALDDPNAEVRRAAVEALAEIDDQ